MPSAAAITVADVVAALEREFDPHWAENWDAVGLVVGDPQRPVESVVLAIDPVPAVVDYARQRQAQLIISHHPLLLSGVTALPRSDPKGAIVHQLIESGIALYVAHTNADVAVGGVNDALADVLSLHEAEPLRAHPANPLDQLTVYVPTGAVDGVLDALAEAGAGRLGQYERAAFFSPGTGTFRPLPGAKPSVGTAGQQETVAETRIDMVVPRGARTAVLSALRRAHPYEEPAFALVEHAATVGARGLGRIGRLSEPTSLRQFTELVAAALPATIWGVRAAGSPERRVETVAVCGGSGGSEVEAARRAGADVYLTSDLKHHVSSEATSERGPAAMGLVDAAHWATEWPWLPRLGRRLTELFGRRLAVHVCPEVTDPWTIHVSTPSEARLL